MNRADRYGLVTEDPTNQCEVDPNWWIDRVKTDIEYAEYDFFCPEMYDAGDVYGKFNSYKKTCIMRQCYSDGGCRHKKCDVGAALLEQCKMTHMKPSHDPDRERKHRIRTAAQTRNACPWTQKLLVIIAYFKTQHEAANYMGVSPSTINKLLKNNYGLGKDLKRRITAMHSMVTSGGEPVALPRSMR